MKRTEATKTRNQTSRPEGATSPPDPQALVEQFAQTETVWPAFQALVELGEAAIPSVREGLGDGRWQIRRWCAAFLDHYGGPECRPWMLPLLQDPKSKVRLMAVHTLACDRCAGGENPVDAVPHLLDRLWHDESIRVRRMAMAMLAQQQPDHRVIEACEEVLERETDRKLRLHATWGLKMHRGDGDEKTTNPTIR